MPITCSDLSIKSAHCWHTDKLFSKFQFGVGFYDNQDFSNLSSMSNTRDYITAVAISSIRLSNEELIQLAKNHSLAGEARNWQRLTPNYGASDKKWWNEVMREINELI